jgi:hypothetical protein
MRGAEVVGLMATGVLVLLGFGVTVLMRISLAVLDIYLLAAGIGKWQRVHSYE